MSGMRDGEAVRPDFSVHVHAERARSGLKLSEAVVDQLHRKRSDIAVVVGDMATSRAPGAFSLVYLVWNSVSNLRTRAEQVECSRNAARHLAAGGRFVVDLCIPGYGGFRPLRRTCRSTSESVTSSTLTTWRPNRALRIITGATATAR
jgi:hypothetical protein